MLKEATERSRFVRNKTLEAASHILFPGKFFHSTRETKVDKSSVKFSIKPNNGRKKTIDSGTQKGSGFTLTDHGECIDKLQQTLPVPVEKVIDSQNINMKVLLPFMASSAALACSFVRKWMKL